jgi:DNA-binding transcriptional regulator YhcF (GntR family)
MDEDENLDEDKRPASRRVAEMLEAEIVVGKYPPGTQLPSYRQIATDHGIALNTAQAAVRILNAKGQVTIRPGSGVYVRDSADAAGTFDVAQVRAALTDLRSKVQRQGRELADTERAIGLLLDQLPPEGAE